MFTNRLSIQSIHRCFVIPTWTQFSPHLEHDEFILKCDKTLASSILTSSVLPSKCSHFFNHVYPVACSFENVPGPNSFKLLAMVLLTNAKIEDFFLYQPNNIFCSIVFWWKMKSPHCHYYKGDRYTAVMDWPKFFFLMAYESFIQYASFLILIQNVFNLICKAC